jgi:hypothetical protein
LAVVALVLIAAADCVAADFAEGFYPAYLFRVNCPADHYVAQWTPGPGDPGKDYFRIATGDLNADCPIYDYNPYTDAALPRRACQDPGGVSRGFPAALIFLGATHCR